MDNSVDNNMSQNMSQDMNKNLNINLLSVFKSFYTDMCNVFPEHEEVLKKNYSSIVELESVDIEANEVLKEFLLRIHKYSKLITDKEEELFEEDPLFLTEISFKEIWLSKISNGTKETIWKYLQTFSLLGIAYHSNMELKNALESLSLDKDTEIKDKSVAKELKKIKKLGEEIQKEIPKEEKEKEEIPPELSEIEKVIQGSEIGKIAEEVSRQVDLEGMLEGLDDDSDMSEVFGKLFSGDGLGKIFNNISSVVNEKMESGELNQDSLQGEAQNMYQSLGQTDMFSNVAQQMMGQGSGQGSGNQPDPMSAMMGLMGQMGQGSGSDNSGNQPDPMSAMMGLMGQMGQMGQGSGNQNNNQPLNPTQARLQKKLEARKKGK